MLEEVLFIFFKTYLIERVCADVLVGAEEDYRADSPLSVEPNTELHVTTLRS